MSHLRCHLPRRGQEEVGNADARIARAAVWKLTTKVVSEKALSDVQKTSSMSFLESNTNYTGKGSGTTRKKNGGDKNLIKPSDP